MNETQTQVFRVLRRKNEDIIILTSSIFKKCNWTRHAFNVWTLAGYNIRVLATGPGRLLRKL
jgi:hypothetical protein